MILINDKIETQIEAEITNKMLQGEVDLAVLNIPVILDAIYKAIPEKKRISHGRFSTIKVLAEHLYHKFVAMNISTLEVGARITNLSKNYRAIGVGLGILSLYGLDDYPSILPYFELAAGSDHWEPREYAQGLFRKIIKKHRYEIKNYLLELVQSDNAKLRRFVSETLRPVVENQWLYQEIDYSLYILRHLFLESNAYPRTSVGNNLSDIARRKPELVYDLVDELVALNDKNATWIATRACRNLVKVDPIRVMDHLVVNEYKYKQRVYKRSDYQ
jgi:3-methyladenine DNA glycosylase AlkC